MGDPIFWLGLSILLVAISLAAVLVTALPALQELARAARSAEKLFDTLSRELPPTLESIRLTSREINNLKADMSEGVQGTSQVVQEVGSSITGVKQQAKQVHTTTRGVMAGVKAAWSAFKGSDRRSPRRLSASTTEAFEPEAFEPEEFDSEAFESEELDLEEFQEIAFSEAEFLEQASVTHKPNDAVLQEGDVAARSISDRNGHYSPVDSPVGSPVVAQQAAGGENYRRDAEGAEGKGVGGRG